MVKRTIAAKATPVRAETLTKNHGPFMFDRCGGAREYRHADGNPEGKFMTGSTDSLLDNNPSPSPSEIATAGVGHTPLTLFSIDEVQNRVNSFLEGYEDKAFHSRPRMFANTEWAELQSSGVVKTHHERKTMLQKLLLPLLLATSFIAMPAQASEAIVKKARCVACHAVDKKLVGPAYKDVAAKYRGDAGAPARLAAKVRAGGSGVWGEIPMMPHPADKISDADLAAAISWILALE